MNKFFLEVSNCSMCTAHHVAGIVTADSFEHESGLYCMAKPEEEDSWERHTTEGYFPYRMVVSDEWDVRKRANVPDWCPYLIRQYKDIVDYILSSNEFSTAITESTRRLMGAKRGADHGLGHSLRAMSYSEQFLTQCMGLYFRQPNCYASEKDVWLAKIAALLHDCCAGLERHAERGAEFVRKYFRGFIQMQEEDVETIAQAVAKHSDGNDLRTMVEAALFIGDKMDMSWQRVEAGAENLHDEPEWDSANTISTDLSPMLQEMRKIEKVEYVILADRREPYGAELRYKTEKGFKVSKLREWPKCVTGPRMVTKEFLKLRKFNFVVNGEVIDIRRITRKR